MNKYDELLDRAKMFYDQPMVGELMNAVRELKDKADIVRWGECVRPIEDCPFTDFVMMKRDFCSYGKRKEDE